MNEDRSRGSDYDLNRILEEYSAINRDKPMNPAVNNRNSSNVNPQVNRNRTPMNPQSRKPVSENTGSSNDVHFNRRRPPIETANSPKKFVLHIDESAIDSPNDIPIRKAQTNSSGIYFSNYQKKRLRS